MPMLAMMGAAVFILSVLHIPVPVAGSCSHPTGGALAAITIGLFPAMVINFVALIFQTLFLATEECWPWEPIPFPWELWGYYQGMACFDY